MRLRFLQSERRVLGVGVWLLACALLFALPVWSQTTGFTGTVTDQSGAVIPGAKVTITNESTRAVRSTTTAADGGFIFTQLDPGRYKLEVAAQGFKTAVREHIAIAVGITSNLDVRLTVGAVAETVTVEAEVTGVNTTDASLGNVITGVQVLELPSLNLDPSGLLSLQPGVTFVASAPDLVGGYSGTTDIDYRGGSVNGARSDQTNITLDGVDVNDPQFGYAFTSVLRATQESLQEFRVSTSNYNADQGRSSGAEVQLITKSGSNDLHGAAYWAHRNEVLNANDFFANRDGVERGKFRRHIYGAALGGPLIKDRLFIYGNWEELRENLTQLTLRDVPSLAFRDGVLRYACEDINGDGSSADECPGGMVAGVSGAQYQVDPGFYGLTPAEMAAIDPQGIGPNLAALAHFQLYPTPNSPGSFDGLNIVGFNFNAPVDNFFRTFIARVDYNIDRDAKHVLWWRGTLQDDDFIAAVQQFPGLPPNQTKVVNNKGFSLAYRALLSPNWVNTLRWGFTRIGEQTVGQQDSEFIRFRFLSDLEDYASNTFARKVPQNHLRDDVSWARGAHTFSFGGEVRLTRNERFSNANSFHFFSLNPSWLPRVGRHLQPGSSSCLQVGCNAVPAVASIGVSSYRDSAVNLLGIITQATGFYNLDTDGSAIPSGEPLPRRFASNEYELYFQDQWRATSELTLTFGVRYGIFSPPWETEGRQVTPFPSLGSWFERRRQLMEAGLGTNLAGQISYDLGGPANGRDGFYDWDYNNWSPRVAVAWAPHFREGILGTIFGDGKMSIRAGYSIVYDRIGNGLVTSFDDAGSFGLSTNIDSLFGGCDEGPGVQRPGPLGTCPRFTGVFDTTAIATTVLPPAPCPNGFPCTPPGIDQFGVPQFGSFAITSALDDTIVTPYAHVFNLSIARELPWNLSVEGGYVGRRGRNLLMITDLAMPADIRDPASGMTFFQAMRDLLALGEAGQDITTLAPIPFWENLFPGFGPTGVNGGFLDCDFQDVSAGFSIGGFSSTQVAYDMLNCEHPDTTVVPWLIDQFGYPSFLVGGPNDLDVNGDGFPDSPSGLFDDQFATLTAWSSFARSEYHAFQLTVRKRMSYGLAFDLNYTVGKSLDQSSAVERADIAAGAEFGAGYTGSTINSWEPELEYSFSDYDMRHQFNANWLYELPFGKGRQFGSGVPGWVNNIIGGWATSGIVRINSGLPANVINDRVWPTNWNLQGNATCGPSSSLTAVAPCPATSNVKSATHAGVPGSSPNLFADPDAALQMFRFTLPGERGQRNIIRGDNFFNLDFGLTKKFTMPWEGHQMTFRWEVFNLTNSVFFDTGQLSADVGRSGTFGDYTGVLGGPRRMQFTLRYTF